MKISWSLINKLASARSNQKVSSDSSMCFEKRRTGGVTSETRLVQSVSLPIREFYQDESGGSVTENGIKLLLLAAAGGFVVGWTASTPVEQSTGPGCELPTTTVQAPVLGFDVCQPCGRG
jgi:hypothetical protein